MDKSVGENNGTDVGGRHAEESTPPNSGEQFPSSDPPGRLNPQTFSISGTVYEDRTKARISSAVVRAYSKDKDVREAKIEVTNDDGDFTVSGLAPDTWTLTVLSDGYTNSMLKPVEVSLIDKDHKNISLFVRERMGTIDEAVGKRFLKFISTMMGLMVLSYVLVHVLFPPPLRPLSPELTTLVDQAQHHLSGTPLLSENRALSNTLALMNSTLEKIVTTDPDRISPPTQTIISGIVSQIQQLINANNKDGTVQQLNDLKALVYAPQPQDFFWVEDPWRFLEIALWGLAGVLVHLILSSASYLRWGRFYREGIYLHSALLVVMPLIALVIVLLLSLITLKITLSGGNEIVLDLSQPTVLAVVSFLIGARPFASWQLLQATADRFDQSVTPG